MSFSPAIILESTPLACDQRRDVVGAYVDYMFSIGENELLIGIFSTADCDFVFDVTDPSMFAHYHTQPFSARRFYAVDKSVSVRFQLA